MPIQGYVCSTQSRFLYVNNTVKPMHKNIRSSSLFECMDMLHCKTDQCPFEFRITKCKLADIHKCNTKQNESKQKYNIKNTNIWILITSFINSCSLLLIIGSGSMVNETSLHRKMIHILDNCNKIDTEHFTTFIPNHISKKCISC